MKRATFLLLCLISSSLAYAELYLHDEGYLNFWPTTLDRLIYHQKTCLDKLESDFIFSRKKESQVCLHCEYHTDHWKFDQDEMLLRQKVTFREDRFEGSGVNDRFWWKDLASWETVFDLKTGKLTIKYESHSNSNYGHPTEDSIYYLDDLPFFKYRAEMPDRHYKEIRNMSVIPLLETGFSYPITWWREKDNYEPVLNNQNQLIKIDKVEYMKCIVENRNLSLPDDLYQTVEDPFNLNIDQHIREQLENSIFDVDSFQSDRSPRSTNLPN